MPKFRFWVTVKFALQWTKSINPYAHCHPGGGFRVVWGGVRGLYGVLGTPSLRKFPSPISSLKISDAMGRSFLIVQMDVAGGWPLWVAIKVFECPTSWTCAYGHLRSVYDAMPLRGSIYNHCVLSGHFPWHTFRSHAGFTGGPRSGKKIRWGHTLTYKGSIYGAMPLPGSISDVGEIPQFLNRQKFIDLVHIASDIFRELIGEGYF